MAGKEKKDYPLERLIQLQKRVTYQMSIRNGQGQVMKMLCEFQTHSEFIFSGRSGRFELGEAVWVSTRSLKGTAWHPCKVTYVEAHIGYSLYQLSAQPAP